MAEMILTDEFREIPGSPGYDINRVGVVRSWWLRGSRGKRKVDTPAILRTNLLSGYPFLWLGGSRHDFVHRLVLLTFVGPCPDGMEACHNNGVRTDCRLENLRWDTRKNNHTDKWLHGTQQAGSQGGAAILNESQVLEIKQRLANGDRGRYIAADFGVDETTIAAIKSGKNWGHIAADLHEQFHNGHERPGTIRYMAKQAGIPKSTVHARLRRGWDLYRALSEPVHAEHRS